MLRFYFDSGLTEPVETEEETDRVPDEVRESAEQGQDIEDIKTLYLASTDTDLTYENVSVEMSESNGNNVTVEYREEGDTTWEDPLSLLDGDYETGVAIERRVFIENLQEPFNRDDIRHTVNFDKYVKE